MGIVQFVHRLHHVWPRAALVTHLRQRKAPAADVHQVATEGFGWLGLHPPEAMANFEGRMMKTVFGYPVFIIRDNGVCANGGQGCGRFLRREWLSQISSRFLAENRGIDGKENLQNRPRAARRGANLPEPRGLRHT
jgi:hypothetical protein